MEVVFLFIILHDFYSAPWLPWDLKIDALSCTTAASAFARSDSESQPRCSSGSTFGQVWKLTATGFWQSALGEVRTCAERQGGCT